MPDMRAERTRGYLREALLELLREKPYVEITVRKVVERAQVSKNSFYNHFADLASLAQDCYLQRTVFFGPAHKRLRDYACRRDACVETLNEHARTLLFLKENPNLARVILGNVFSSPYFAEIRRAEEDLLLDHIDTEYGDARLPFLLKQHCAHCTMYAVYSLVRAWFVDGMRRSVEDTSKESIYFALHLMAGMAGRCINPEYLQAIMDWHLEAPPPRTVKGRTGGSVTHGKIPNGTERPSGGQQTA